jgi:hypothetical protein
VNTGDNNVLNPERHIPLLSLPLNSNPTCKEVIDFMAVNDGDLSDVGCTALQSYGGYCGCSETPALNQCSFCPNGGSPSTPSKVVSELFTCQGLDDFVTFLTADECQADSTDFLQIQAFAYTCGCPNVQPSCTFCPNGAAPQNPDKLLADGGTTCNEFADLVVTLTADQCTQQASTIDAARNVCGCSGTASTSGAAGQCAIQQNADLCTDALLDTVTEDCECYAFCDGTFVKCQPGEGGLLTSSECIGTPITGCNRAGVAGGSSSAQSGSAQQPSGEDDNTVVVAVAVAVPVAIAFFVAVYYFFTRKTNLEQNDKMNAELEAESEAPIQNMEGSLSMSDVSATPSSPPAPPSSSFMIDSPIAADPENKVV